jgi:hypothetical protein
VGENLDLVDGIQMARNRVAANLDDEYYFTARGYRVRERCWCDSRIHLEMPTLDDLNEIVQYPST